VKVRFLGTDVPGSSVTGGEIYIQKVLAFLKQAGDSVVIVSWGHLPRWLRRSPLFCNLWCFFKLLFQESSLVIEPESHRDHLFLCNWLLQFTRHRVVVFIQLVRFGRSEPWPVSRWQKWVYRVFLRNADIVIVNSNYVGWPGAARPRREGCRRGNRKPHHLVCIESGRKKGARVPSQGSCVTS